MRIRQVDPPSASGPEGGRTNHIHKLACAPFPARRSPVRGPGSHTHRTLTSRCISVSTGSRRARRYPGVRLGTTNLSYLSAFGRRRAAQEGCGRADGVRLQRYRQCRVVPGDRTGTRILEITVRLCLCSGKPSTLPHPHGRRADELSNINVHGAPGRPVLN